MNLLARDWKALHADGDTIQIEFPGFLVMTVRRNGRSARIELDKRNPRLKALRIRVPLADGEKVFGLADGYRAIGLSGRVSELFSSLNLASPYARAIGGRLGIKRGKTYYPRLAQALCPRFAGSHGLFLCIETASALRVDHRPARALHVDSRGFPASVTVGKAESQALARAEVNRLCAQKPGMPEWAAQGIWLSLSGGEGPVAKNLSAVLDAGAKVSAIVLKDWAGMHPSRKPRWNWTTDRSRYASLEDDVARFRQAGIRVIAYLTPYLDEDSPNFSEAVKKGWLLGDHEGKPHLVNTSDGRAGFVNLWNAEAFGALKSVITEKILGIGMSAWFADHGFFFPPKNAAFKGKSASEFCAEYASLWAKLNSEALLESGRPGEAACIMRPVDPGRGGNANGLHLLCAHARTTTWGEHGLAGELMARTCEPGIFFSEIGGAGAGAAERELFMRWTEASAFSPVFCNGDASPVQPWDDPALLAHFCRMATIHTLLHEYHKDTLDSYRREGYPPHSHPSVQYGLSRGQSVSGDQFLYGKDLLVMPITARKKTFAQGALPPDSWIHLWSTRSFEGGSVTVEAPLGYPAVFFRADSRWASLFDKIRLEAKRLA